MKFRICMKLGPTTVNHIVFVSCVSSNLWCFNYEIIRTCLNKTTSNRNGPRFTTACQCKREAVKTDSCFSAMTASQFRAQCENTVSLIQEDDTVEMEVESSDEGDSTTDEEVEDERAPKAKPPPPAAQQAPPPPPPSAPRAPAPPMPAPPPGGDKAPLPPPPPPSEQPQPPPLPPTPDMVIIKKDYDPKGESSGRVFFASKIHFLCVFVDK